MTVVSPNPASVDYFLVESHSWHWSLSLDNINNLHMLSKCCQGWCGCRRVYLGLDHCQNLQFGSPILHISLTKVLGCIPPTWLDHFVKPHLLQPKTLHAVLYRFGDCAPHPARFIIITNLAVLGIIFIIFQVFPILLVVETYKITHTVSDSIQHLCKHCFRLSRCHSYVFSSCQTF